LFLFETGSFIITMSKKSVKQYIQKTNPSGNKNFTPSIFLALTVIFVFICLNNKFVQDDAFISFRYVQNFVDGNGLVFNIGERVEGYTNLLWVLILSVFVFLNINIQTISQILSVLFGVVVLFMTYKLSKIFRIKLASESIKKISTGDSSSSIRYFDLIPSILLLFSSSFIFWSVSGMESTMFISFCLLGIYYYIKNKNSDILDFKFPFFILLATLTRPEGLYFFGLIMIHKIFFAFKDHRSDALKVLFAKNNIISYTFYIVPVLFYFIIRYSYYGYLLPNTYYAKTGFSSVYLNSGIEYFTKFLTSYLFYGVILVIPLYLFKKKRNFFVLSLLYFIIICYTLYIILVGGDVLNQNRFFLPILPLIYILFVKFLTVLYYLIKSRSGNNRIAYSSVFMITAVVCIYYYSSQKELLDKDVQWEIGLVDRMKIAGNWFKNKQQQFGRPLNLGVTTIGSISFFAGPKVNIIDLLGLTDKEIAHNPKIIPEISEQTLGWKERNYNADYVMSRDPDYIYFSTGVKPSAYAERALYTTEEFIKYYYPYYFTDEANDFTDVVYKRKSDDEVKDIKTDFPGNPNYKPTYVNMFNQAINTSLDKTKGQVALSEFKQALSTGPAGFGLPYQYMGDILLQMGKKEEAIENYKKAVEKNDHNVFSHYKLYQLYSEIGDTVNANSSLGKVKKYDPENLR